MNPFKTLSNRRGTVFLTTMVCIFLMSTTSGYLYVMSAQNSHYANRLQKSTQALMLAESGLARALSTIQDDWGTTSSDGNFPTTALGTGTYNASVSAISGRYLVSSVGTVQGVTRTVSAEVSPPAISALDFAIAGGSIAAHVIDPGTGQAAGTIIGDVYSAGPLTLDGPTGGTLLSITGDVYGASTISTASSVAVSGSQTANYTTTVNFPTVDFSHYQTIATANSQYYSTSQTFASGGLPAAPSGGVIYVNGNVTIRGTQSTTACIIATGNILIEKSGSTYPRVTINQFGNYPALMTQNGNITYTTTGNASPDAYLTATGLIYSGNGFTVDTGNHANLTVTGSILAKGVIDTDGMTAWNNFNVTYVEQNPDGFDNGDGDFEILSYNV